MNNHFPAYVLYGPGTVARIEWDREKKRVLIITDRGLLKTGNIKRVHKVFPHADVYGEIVGEPTSEMVDAAVEYGRRGRYDLVIGIGGGSALDTAKIVAALLKGKESVTAVFGKDRLQPRQTRLGLIPTTAGTGSEASINSIIKDSTDGIKKSVISREMIPDWVVLDAELTMSLPAPITASTGMDALCHCIESALSLNANDFSVIYSYHGMKLLSKNIEQAVAEGTNLEARGAMLLGSFLGGLAITRAGTTAVHALSYPLGKRNIPHGVANGMLLPWILDYNLPACQDKMMELVPYLDSKKPLAAAEDIVALTMELVKTLPVPKTLAEVGIGEECLSELAAEAMEQKRLLVNNPRSMDQEAVETIYRKLLF
jgi:alcohol dehydrogenase class IV